MPLTEALGPWHDLYALLGSAAANLIGLLFIAASVGARFYTRDKLPALRVFLSPSVVHLGCILVGCLITMVPTPRWPITGALITSVGLFGMVYAGLVVRNVINHGLHSMIELDDQFWYLGLPALGYLVAAGAGIAFMLRSAVGCALLALSLVILLLIAIRNAWDITVWAVTRPTDE